HLVYPGAQCPQDPQCPRDLTCVRDVNPQSASQAACTLRCGDSGDVNGLGFKSPGVLFLPELDFAPQLVILGTPPPPGADECDLINKLGDEVFRIDLGCGISGGI